MPYKCKKIEELLPERLLTGFSKRALKKINEAMREEIPILFLGGKNTGKTLSVRLLQAEGIAAFELNNFVRVDFDKRKVEENG